jgi:hypothetical protein
VARQSQTTPAVSNDYTDISTPFISLSVPSVHVPVVTDMDDSALNNFCESARIKSLSVGHFSTIVVKHLFSDEQRVNKNCTGSKGKEALGSQKLELVKSIVFKYFDVIGNDKKNVWKTCVSRIDEMLRRKIRNKDI